MPSASEYEQFFTDADTDNSGTLTLNELVAILKKKGYRGSDSELAKLFACVDVSGDGRITKDEYMVGMGQQPPDVHGKASMRSCFVSFDKDCSGKIDANELDEVFKEMGKHFSSKEISRMMELMDKDKTGAVEYEEFIEHFFNKK